MIARLLGVLPLLHLALARPSEYDGMGSGGGHWDQSGGYDQQWGGGQGGDVIYATTLTQTAGSAYQTPQYGSGSWGKVTDLNSCLQTCQVTFGGGQWGGGDLGSDQPPSGTDSGGPATHTIIVAPTQGVLRYVPFAVNAMPGDKLHYIWGAGPHSVTLSDGQNVCNKSTSSLAFDSGKLNVTSTFDQVVQGDASSPQFYYCTVGPHCSKGMFGLINPPMSNVSNELTDEATKTSPPVGKSTAGNGGGSQCVGDSMACWIDRWKGTSSEARQKHDGVKGKCSSVPEAWAWGSKWDMSRWDVTVVTKEVIIENVLYTRYMLASNPSMLDTTKPFPSDWVAVPDLNSFVTASNTTANDPVYGGDPVSASSPGPSASGTTNSSGNGTGAGLADAKPSTGGESRLVVSTAAGTVACFLALMVTLLL
ncbi:hypothetical protein DB88DRAFT_510201 [Papiliotrema laurentii]|uniref:Phytocyanin domain-containing protein n=1 Tax=Papiliotrema laurentii TaxID=5418 RepID=A0AAD9FS32_PAPLA|nr:hypothetical protein DB88DRAFT_510201 [Papiliotrema laurentii]